MEVQRCWTVLNCGGKTSVPRIRIMASLAGMWRVPFVVVSVREAMGKRWTMSN